MQLVPGIDDVLRAVRLPGFDGRKAQERMAPRPRALVRPERTPEAPHEGAVAIILFPRNDSLHFPLIRRTETVERHKGQISLPGGERMPGEALHDAALREAREELGLAIDCTAEIVGLTPLYIPASNFQVHPFTVIAAPPDAYRPDPSEVAEVIEVELPQLLDETAKAEEVWTIHGVPTQVPHYRLAGRAVWGATAMILAELEARLREAMV